MMALGSAGWEKIPQQQMQVLWKRTLTQAKLAGVSLPPSLEGNDPPKEWEKIAYFTDLMNILIKNDPSNFIKKKKSIAEYVKQVVAPALGMKPTSDVSAMKQAALLGLRLEPAWTRIMQNLNPDQVLSSANEVRRVMRNTPGWGTSTLRDEFTKDDWKLKVLGTESPLFLIGHASVVAGQAHMPWSVKDTQGQIQELPFPTDSYLEGMKVSSQECRLESGYLLPAHLLIGGPNAGGPAGKNQAVVSISNSMASAGMPYPTIEPDQARKLTSDGLPPKKYNVGREECKHLFDWLKAGHPWTGPLYDRVAQPATMWKRGDAKVSIEYLQFANAMNDAGYPLMAMMSPGRGIVIVPYAVTALELMTVKPFQEHLATMDVQCIDQRSRRHTKTVMRNIINRVLGGEVRATGADVARWDMNFYPGEFGVEAASIASMFAPGPTEILLGCASRPALWTPEQVDFLQENLAVGDSMKITVQVPDSEGQGTHGESVEVTKISVNMRELIIQTIQMVNGSGLHMAGYDFNVQKRKVLVPKKLLTWKENTPHEDDKDYVIYVHGCRRSGSGGTSRDNSRHNLQGYAGAMHQLISTRDPSKGLVAKRAALVGLPTPTKVEGSIESLVRLVRGDDKVIADNLRVWSKGTEWTHDMIVSLVYSIFGRYGNAAKQRTGDWNRPDLEFAAEYYDEFFTGGVTEPERSLTRSITQESSTDVAELRPQADHEFDAKRVDLGLVADTLSAKSRIAPQRGSERPNSPMGSPTPGNEELIRLIAQMDKHGLVYGNTDLTVEELGSMIESEALRYAGREARKHNMDEKLILELIDEWKEAELHALLAQIWLERDSAESNLKRAPQGAKKWFVAKVEQLKKDGKDSEE
jgi:hypothetical protein